MATPSLYDVDRAAVLARIPQLAARGSKLPSYDTIDTDGQVLNEAASILATALDRGGYGLAPDVDSGTVAYYFLRGVLIECAALKYVEQIGTDFDSERMRDSKNALNNSLREIEAGKSIGELSSLTNQRVAVFRHGDTTRAALNARRYKADSSM